MLALGLMSGTSRDGVDAAAMHTDGERHAAPMGFVSVPYESAFRRRLGEVIAGHGDREAVARELTDRHAGAVERLLANTGLRARDVELIGFHGHTIAHAPERGITDQLGEPARLAAATGIDVVGGFRSADVAAGGQGAPLAPLYHRARAAGLAKPLAVLNLGGVGNVTYLGADDTVLAFDTGPGNALVDDLIAARTGEQCDTGGRWAMTGTVADELLARWLADPFFDRPPPKALDRDAFAVDEAARLDTANASATLTAFTAASVARAHDHLPATPVRWLVTGGGRHNPALMAALRARVTGTVEPVEAVGWDGDALEAEAFAYLAVRAAHGQPLSLPTTTGVPAPQPAGRVYGATGSAV